MDVFVLLLILFVAWRLAQGWQTRTAPPPHRTLRDWDGDTALDAPHETPDNTALETASPDRRYRTVVRAEARPALSLIHI